MSKYKVGDKVVLTVSDVNEKACYPYYVLNGNFTLWKSSTDKYTEPLSTYTEPLEAEITRLLAENKELKEDFEKSKRVNLNMGRLAGQNEAWELSRKIVSDIYHGGYNSDELKEIFGYFIYQNIWEDNTYPEAAAKVAQWEKAKEKPQKTILMDLLEKLPNIETEVDGLPKFCPFALGYDVLCSSKKTCKECWNRPLEQIGEE